MNKVILDTAEDAVRCRYCKGALFASRRRLVLGYLDNKTHEQRFMQFHPTCFEELKDEMLDLSDIDDLTTNL